MQQIFLCSDQHSKATDQVNSHLFEILKQTNQKIVYIPSESDPQRRYFAKTADYYRYLGFHDITYFGIGSEDETGTWETVSHCAAVHLSGGRTAPFLASLLQRNFLQQLKNHLEHHGVIIGVSAGAMVLGQRVFAEPYPEQKEAPQGKRKRNQKSESSPLRGLGILPFDVLPHHTGCSQELASIDSHRLLTKNAVWALGEDDALHLWRNCKDEAWSIAPKGEPHLFARSTMQR